MASENEKVYPVRAAAVRVLRCYDAAAVGKEGSVATPSASQPIESTCVVKIPGIDDEVEVDMDAVEILYPTRTKEICVILHGPNRGARGTIIDITGNEMFALKLGNGQMLELPRKHLAKFSEV